MLGSVVLKDGAEVESGGRRFVIMQVIGFDAVVARHIETEELVRLAVLGLKPSRASSTVPAQPDLSEVDEREWTEARRRLNLIGPLLDGTRHPRAVIVERALGAGFDASTLYRWARAYPTSADAYKPKVKPILNLVLPLGGNDGLRPKICDIGRCAA